MIVLLQLVGRGDDEGDGRDEDHGEGEHCHELGQVAARSRCRRSNLFIYQARESSLVPAGFLTAQFLQKM